MSRLEFRLPDVGEGLSEAEIVEWAVAVGDTVAEDQPIVSVNTDKSIVDIPAPTAGTIVELGGEVGDVLPIGALLAVIAVDDDATGPATPPAGTDDAPVASSAAPSPAGPFQPVGAAPSDGERPPADQGARKPLRAAPATRRLATELGVDLTAVNGTGPNGRITADDVRAAARTPAAPATAGATQHPAAPRATSAGRPARGETPDRTEPLRGTRRQIARTMAAAWSVPHITDFREIDAAELVRVHGRLRDRIGGGRLTFLPLFVRAAAAALRRHPSFNARIDVEADEITYRSSVNIGIAAATQHGLVVPVVADADHRSLEDIAEEIARLAEAARAGRLEPGDSADGTFTISNFGSYGTWLGTPIIRPPEVAIAGFGRIADRVVAVDGQPVVRPVLPLAVATDHRLNDGADLGAFAATLADLLRDPVLLLAEQ